MEKIKKITLSYDSDNDILDIIIGESAREAISVESEDEVFLRLDPDTKDIVGITILGFKNYILEEKGKKIHELMAEMPV